MRVYLRALECCDVRGLVGRLSQRLVLSLRNLEIVPSAIERWRIAPTVDLTLTKGALYQRPLARRRQ